MTNDKPHTLLGSAILSGPANIYALRVGVIGAVETSGAGNVILRTGHTEYGMDHWEGASTNPHITLTPAEVDELIARLEAARPKDDDAEATYSALMDLKGTLDDRITLLSVRALAQYARNEYPEAATLVLHHDNWNDPMEVVHVIAADGAALPYDRDADYERWEQAWHHLSNLAARGQAAHVAHVAPAVLVQSDRDWWRLNLDAALALPADGSKPAPATEEATR